MTHTEVTEVIKYLNNIIYMGMSESAFKAVLEPVNNLVHDVLGSIDLACKMNCCKSINCYSHCRTIETNDVDITTEE